MVTLSQFASNPICANKKRDKDRVTENSQGQRDLRSDERAALKIWFELNKVALLDEKGHP